MADPSSYPPGQPSADTPVEFACSRGPSDAQPAQANRPCVLISSSDEAAARQILDALDSAGIAAFRCNSPAGCAHLVKNLDAAAAMMDMDDCASTVAENVATLREADPRLPVILVTGERYAHAAMDEVDKGAYDFVDKPIDTRRLLASVRRALGHSSLLRAHHMRDQILEETVEKRVLQVAREKDFLRGILDSSTLVSVVLTDLSQNVLFWNTGARNIFGYSEEEMVGNSITRLYPHDQVTDSIVKKLQRMVATKSGTVHGKMKQVAKDGRILTISLALSPMLAASGDLRGILGVGLDVTEEEHLQEELLKSYQQIKKTQDVTIFSLAKLAESRDEETGNHLVRIQQFCRSLSQKLANREPYSHFMNESYIEDLVRSSILHDIGKVGIPDAILLAPRKLTREEFEIMKKHPVIGGQALDEAVKQLGEHSFLTLARDIAYGHHERWDGSGYPFGVKGDAIPIAARIAALADVYDALTSRRRYKDAFSHGEAARIIDEGKGKHFDPTVVDVFHEASSEFDTIRRSFSGFHDQH